MIVLLAGTAPARPDSASETFHPMDTSPRYHPLPLAAVVGVPVRLGAVLSMLISLTPALFVLSALSTAVPATDWSRPSVDTATLPPPVQALMPDSTSEQVKPTVTSVLFQPAPFAAGFRVALIVGAALSSFTCTCPAG